MMTIGESGSLIKGSRIWKWKRPNLEIGITVCLTTESRGALFSLKIRTVCDFFFNFGFVNFNLDGFLFTALEEALTSLFGENNWVVDAILEKNNDWRTKMIDQDEDNIFVNKRDKRSSITKEQVESTRFL